MYNYLNIEKIFSDVLIKYEKDPNFVNIQKEALKNLHNDWDKINAKVRSTYPDVALTPEVIELNIIKFMSDTQTNYVNWDIIKSITDYLRQYDPLKQDINMIIENIFNLTFSNQDKITTLKRQISLN